MNAETLRREFKELTSDAHADRIELAIMIWSWEIVGSQKALITALCRKAGQLLNGEGDPLDRWLDHLLYRGEYVTSIEDEFSIAGPVEITRITPLREASIVALLELPQVLPEKVAGGVVGGQNAVSTDQPNGGIMPTPPSAPSNAIECLHASLVGLRRGCYAIANRRVDEINRQKRGLDREPSEADWKLLVNGTPPENPSTWGSLLWRCRQTLVQFWRDWMDSVEYLRRLPAAVKSDHDRWHARLGTTLAKLRNEFNRDADSSPAERVYGFYLSPPSQYSLTELTSELSEHIDRLHGELLANDFTQGKSIAIDSATEVKVGAAKKTEAVTPTVKWCIETANAEIQRYLDKHSEAYEAAKSGHVGAKTAASSIFSQRTISKKTRIPKTTVADSPIYQRMRDELGLGKSRTGKKTKVGVGMAVEEKSESLGDTTVDALDRDSVIRQVRKWPGLDREYRKTLITSLETGGADPTDTLASLKAMDTAS